jgi:DNA-directed RNA polymerase specialized sigma subunit
MSINQRWSQRDQEALRAWERGDQNGLIKAYEPDVRKLAERFGQDSRRNKSDELRLHSQDARYEEGRLREAASAEDGLRKIIEVADPDELYQVGCEALLDAADRCDPKRGVPPLGFAYKRIRGVMLDLLAKRRKLETEQASSGGSGLHPKIQ